MVSRKGRRSRRSLIGRNGEVRDLSTVEPKRFRAAAEVLPADFVDLARSAKRRRGPQKEPTKLAVNIRLSPEVVAHFRAAGPGWQTRIDAALRKVVGLR